MENCFLVAALAVFCVISIGTQVSGTVMLFIMKRQLDQLVDKKRKG